MLAPMVKVPHALSASALTTASPRPASAMTTMKSTAMAPVVPAAGAIAVLFIVVIALAGLGLAVVNALAESAWGTFTIGASIPLAILMGFHMFKWRKGHIREATIVGVTLMILAVILGRPVANSPIASWFLLSRHQITFALCVYGFAASVLPVWMLLTPRDYLSTFMKIGTILFLILGVVIVHPTLQAPAVSQFAGGGGPIIPGPLFPFVFITIACGAISGFHSLIATGTTP